MLPFVNSHYGNLDPIVANWLARVIAASSAASSTTVNAHNILIKALRSAGLLSKILRMNLFAANDLAGALIPIINSNGSAADTNHNFVSGDFSLSTGLQGNGSSKYLDTGLNYNALTSGFGGVGFWLGQDITSTPNDQWLIGAGFGSTPQMGLAWSSGPQCVNGRWGGTATAQFNIPTLRTGLYHAERTTLSRLDLYCNGVYSGKTTSAVTNAQRSQSIHVFAMAAALFTDRKGFGYFITDGTFSAAQAKVLADIVQRFMVTLGRVTQLSKDTTPIEYIGVLGQSLAAGASPALSTSQAYSALMFQEGNIPTLGNSSSPAGNPANSAPTIACLAAARPLVEVTNETICSSFARFISAKFRSLNGSAPDPTLHDPFLGVYDAGSTAYTGIKKGTNVYNNHMDSISNLMTIAWQKRAGGVIVPACMIIHGESDMSSTTYQTDINQWQSDIDSDIKAKTLQLQTVLMFHSQPSCWTATSNINAATGKSPFAIYNEYKANPTKTLLVCAKYIWASPDGVHLSNSQYQHLGEYYAKAFYQHYILGVQWSPLMPSSISRSGADIDITFQGNIGNLQFDTTNVTDPGSAKGFEYTDGGTPPAISSVSITGANTVRITLASTPTGANKRIRYAYTGTPGQPAGPTTGPRGCLKDSDTETSPGGFNLNNWCVHFDEACP